ncbi:sugar ABC transporter substrate-binding protein, partial [Burkholderia multivorans]
MTFSAACAAIAPAIRPAAQAAENVTVLHWWASGGESKAVGVVKEELR